MSGVRTHIASIRTTAFVAFLLACAGFLFYVWTVTLMRTLITIIQPLGCINFAP